MEKKEWYKRWWGVILAIMFLPLFALWWIWKKSKMTPQNRKVSLIIVGVFSFLFYGGFTAIAITSIGAPVLDYIKSPTTQESVNLSGFGVASEAKVKLILNDKDFQEVQADTSGKFSFSNVKLNEGENTLKASTITKEGKTKTSSETKLVYKKPQSTQASTNQQTEATKPAETPATTPEAVVEPPKQENVYDKLWKALDESVRTRKGFSIEYEGKFFDNSTVQKRDNNLARLQIEPADYWDETAMVKTAYQQFVQYGLKAFQIGEVDEIEFIYWNNFTDQYGKSQKEKAVDISMTKTEFSKYDWKNLVGQNIYQQMRSSCTEHYIHPAIMKNLKLDKLTLLAL